MLDWREHVHRHLIAGRAGVKAVEDKALAVVETGDASAAASAEAAHVHVPFEVADVAPAIVDQLHLNVVVSSIQVVDGQRVGAVIEALEGTNPK